MEVKPLRQSAVQAGYKQTEVGVIPEEWEVEPLGELSDFVTSGSRGWAQFYSENGALFIRSQNVRDGRLSFEDVQYVSPPTGAEGNRTKVKPNDLLITITGNSVGNVALVEQTFDEAYISQHVGLVRLKEPTRGAYICRYLSPNSPGNPQIAGSQSGQSKPGLNLQNLKDFRIALPPTANELHAIALALSDVDGLLGGLDQLIAKKRDLKQAAMQQLLTGQTRLPGFQGKWKFERLGKGILLLSGHHILAEHYNTQGDGVPYITGPADFPGGRIQHTKFTKYPSTICSPNDILVTVKGSGSGAIVLADAAYCISRQLMAIRVSGWDCRFIYYSLLQTATKFKAASTGLIPGLSRSDILDQPLPLPPTVLEQTAIAEILTDMDAELATLEQRREKTRALKQAMMQELLTGRTRLMK